MIFTDRYLIDCQLTHRIMQTIEDDARATFEDTHVEEAETEDLMDEDEEVSAEFDSIVVGEEVRRLLFFLNTTSLEMSILLTKTMLVYRRVVSWHYL